MKLNRLYFLKCTMINNTQLTSMLIAMENLTMYNFTYPPEDVTSNLRVQIIFYICYVIIFLLGTFGNVLVVFAVARNRQMHTVTNLFIANLALSDVLLCMLAVPFTPLYTFMGGWVFGETLCHLVPYAQGVSVYISTFTLTNIAFDRFLVILYPFRPRMKIETCLMIILSIWIIALLLTLPYGLFMKLEENIFCEEHWPNERFRKIFSSMTTTMQFIVPFIVIAFCYACVWVKLRDQARVKPGSKSSQREEADRERKRRTNRMLVAMVGIFGMCWLPINMVNVVGDFISNATNWSYYRLIFFMTHSIAMSSTCYNPFLYAWLNENFRKEFKQILPCFSRRSNSNNTGTMEVCCKNDKTCNGNNTMQETLLPSKVTKSKDVLGREMIVLESEQPSCSYRIEDTFL